MAASATPYGARAIGTLSASGSFSGKVQHIKIVDAYAVNIFYGDFVKLVSTGTIQKDAGTTTLTSVGIFVGCSYTPNSTGQKTFGQMWIASTDCSTADDIVAYVITDPDVVFQMQGDASCAQTTLGNNAAVVQTSGSTSLGRSKNALDASTAATTKTLPLRIIDFVNGPDSSVGDSYTDTIVTFNSLGATGASVTTTHQFRDPLGI